MRPFRPALTGTLAILLAAAPVEATAPGARSAAPAAPAGERRFSIIYTAEVHGAVEPCGCTSDPLGDISRFAEVVRAARRESGAVLLVDAGGLLYAEGGMSSKERPAAELRAAFLGAQLEKLGLHGAGLAETDLAGGVPLLQPKRLASNLPAPAAIQPPGVEVVGGVKVGLLGVADPTLGERLGVKSDDLIKSARRDAERLRRDGAEVVVLLAPVDKALARRVAREAAVDFVVLGRQVGNGMPRAESVDHAGDQAASPAAARAFLVAPADELQRVGRIDVVLRGGAVTALRDAGGAEAVRLRRDEIARQLQRLDDELARWTSGGGAAGAQAQKDPAFVAAKAREREALIGERDQLGATWTAPAPSAGSYFTNRLVSLNRSLPRDPQLVGAMKRLDARIAAVNLKNAVPPPPPEPDRAAYVGVARCGGCHKAAVAFWKKTVHAGAWKTLVDGGKQADYKCIGCHLTGYGQVGGSALGFTKGLESVQCENCHGPASIHVAQKGLEEPSAVHKETPETTCVACHTERHSDTFQYQPYLRDVLGPGHGAAARQKLGDGPTGHTLRTAALARAAAR
jgi:hypothetical protein